MNRDTTRLLLPSVKKLLHLQGRQQLDHIIERAHPADLAQVFNLLTRPERLDFFAAVESLDLEKAAELLTEIERSALIDLLDGFDDRRLTRLLEVMSYDDVTDLLGVIEDEDRRELLLTMMKREELATTQSLMSHDPETAGGLMTPEFFAVEETTTASEALRRLQEDAGATEMVFYIYVTNDHGQLVGVTSLRELVLSPRERILKDFMIHEVLRVNVGTDQEEVARYIARYNLVALPVVDGNNELVGVVTVDDIIDVIRLEATEDMLLMAGAGSQDVEDYSSAMSSFQARLPWMVPSFAGGIVAMAILMRNEALLARVLPLTFFIPLIVSMSRTIGLQSSTIVLRGVTLGRADFGQLGRVVASELAVGGASGLIFGLLLLATSFAIFGDHPAILAAPAFSMTLGLCLIVCSASSAAIGALVPAICERMRLDPAAWTRPLVSTTIDFSSVAAIIFLAYLTLGGAS
jgi:magnesium transporter